MADKVCPAEVTGLNANVKIEIPPSSEAALSGNWCRIDKAIGDLAELPFLQVDIEEVFEISYKKDAKPRKKWRLRCRRKRNYRLSRVSQHQKKDAAGSKMEEPALHQTAESLEEAQKQCEVHGNHSLIDQTPGTAVPNQALQQPESNEGSEEPDQQQWKIKERLKKESDQHQHQADTASDIAEQLCPAQERSEVKEQQENQAEGNLKGPEQQLQDKDDENEAKKNLRKRPNYFVAIPITNDQILDKIEDVQELIVTKEDKLLRALIPVEKVHLTIIVAHLQTAEEVQKAVSAMIQCEAKIEDVLMGKPLHMTFHGIGQFNGQVIYVKMADCEEQLSKIAESIVTCFAEMGIDITGSKVFKPHLTFLKLSKAPSLRRKGFKKVCSALYEGFEDVAFGTEILSRIDLCSMHKKQQESGYYFY